MELYLRYLEKFETEKGEDSPIGLILCTEGSKEQIELLQLDDSGIRVAEYLVELPPKEEELELVGLSNCGGCPGGNIEYVPEEMIKNGAEVIHFATGMVVGYPPCPYINQFKEFVETRYNIPVVIGTHPIPLKYYNTHNNLSSWKTMKMDEICMPLMTEDKNIMESYN